MGPVRNACTRIVAVNVRPACANREFLEQFRAQGSAISRAQLQSPARIKCVSTLYRPAHSGASGPGRANQSKLASARRIRLAPMTFGSGSSLKDG